MNSVWRRKLWLGCSPERGFEGFEIATSSAVIEETAIVYDIISMGITMDLGVDSEVIEELVEDCCTEVSPEELVHLQNEQQKTAEKMFSVEE